MKRSAQQYVAFSCWLGAATAFPLALTTPGQIAPNNCSQAAQSAQAAVPPNLRAERIRRTAPHPDEDWTSPSLARVHLHPQAPLLIDRTQTPDFTREIIRLCWRAGDPIDVYLIRPVKISKPPVILYLYSYPSETDRFLDASYCKHVTAGGSAAVGFLSALTGDRYHGRPMKEWFVSELPEALAGSAHDVQYLLNYLRSRNDLDMDRIGIFGQGSGGTIGILAAAVDTRIKALDLLDPWGDWKPWMAHSALVPEAERPRYVTAAFQKTIAPLDPVRWLGRLRGRRLRIQSTADDTVTPLPCQQRLQQAAPPGTVRRIYEDTFAHFHEMSGHLTDWLDQQLKALS